MDNFTKITLSFVVIMQIAIISIVLFEDATTETVEGTYFNISNNSNSMGNIFSYPDRLIAEKYNTNNDLLREGEIYVYQHANDSGLVVHRLVKCLDIDCNVTIFKGDNNKKADDLVNKTQIKYIITGIDYS